MTHETFQLARGLRVPDLAGIREGYERKVAPQGHSVFTVNVSAERLELVFRRLAAEVSEPSFFLLEAPCHESVERELRRSPEDPFHRDVFYLDGIGQGDLAEILRLYGDVLVHDGMVQFGFGMGGGTDEVFVGAYKILYVYATAPEKYVRSLDELGIPEVRTLETVRHRFTRDSPGSRHALTDVDKSIWDVIEELRGRGLYLGDRREG